MKPRIKLTLLTEAEDVTKDGNDLTWRLTINGKPFPTCGDLSDGTYTEAVNHINLYKNIEGTAGD